MLHTGFVQLTISHLTLTIQMGEMVLEASCGLSNEQLFHMPIGQTQIYPTAGVDKQFGQMTAKQQRFCCHDS